MAARRASVDSSIASMMKPRMRKPSLGIDNLYDMRVPYRGMHDIFDVHHIPCKDPMVQFGIWFSEAKAHRGIKEANCMSVATADSEGRPSCRWLLLKGFDERGFVFFTNYQSRKGKDLAANPQISLGFYWEPLNRQVRVEGHVEKVPEADSQEYFDSRPAPSRIAALASQQSSVIPDRAALDKINSDLTAFYSDNKPIPKPDYWGGYLVVPRSVEFWQGQTTRLHDRIRFRRQEETEELDPLLTHVGENGWVYERLAP